MCVCLCTVNVMLLAIPITDARIEKQFNARIGKQKLTCKAVILVKVKTT